MRLLIVQAGFGAGGAEKIVAMLAAHRSKLGDDVHVAGLTSPPEGAFFDHPGDVTLHIARPGAVSGGRTAQLARLRHIRRCISSIRPDVAIAFLTKVNTLTVLAASGLGVPVVISERNNRGMQKASALWRPLHAFAASQAAAIVMQTDRAREDLRHPLQQKATVIPNPCSPIGRPRGAPPPGQGLHLVAVGRLDRQKGFDLLLQAFAMIRTRHPKLQLTIFGDGPERDVLLGLAQRLGVTDDVRFPGLTARPGAWIEMGDILVLPSRYEGFPNVAAEATVSGMPVVAFDCRYGPRELIEDRRNGILVPEEDVGAMAEAISRLVDDPALRERMSAAAYLNRERLSPHAVMAMWDETIEAAAAGERLVPAF